MAKAVSYTIEFCSGKQDAFTAGLELAETFAKWLESPNAKFGMKVDRQGQEGTYLINFKHIEKLTTSEPVQTQEQPFSIKN